jgi:hypothetical protein
VTGLSGRYRPSAYLSARLLAELFQPVAAETPAGGRSVSYEPLGVVWLAPGTRRRRERAEAGAPARILETLTATTRTDGRLAVGRLLRFGGADWAVRMVEPETPRPGRATLSLERER